MQLFFYINVLRQKIKSYNFVKEIIMLLSEIISKKVINICDAKVEGTISDIFVKNNRVCFLKIFTDNEEELLVDAKKLYNTCGDVFVIKNSTALVVVNSTINNFSSCPIGKACYDCAGTFQGNVNDLSINDKFCVDKYMTTHKIIDSSEILITGQILITNNQSKPLSFFKPKIPSGTERMRKVKILGNHNTIESSIMDIDNQIKTEKNEIKYNLDLPFISPQENNQQINANKIANYKQPTISIINESEQHTPKKVVGLGSGTFLIGRKVTKTIFGINNEIIARKNATISRQTISICSAHGKLIELALNSVEK